MVVQIKGSQFWMARYQLSFGTVIKLFHPGFDSEIAAIEKDVEEDGITISISCSKQRLAAPEAAIMAEGLQLAAKIADDFEKWWDSDLLPCGSWAEVDSQQKAIASDN